MPLATNRIIKIVKQSEIEIVNKISRCERELFFKIGVNDYSVKIIFPNNKYVSTIESCICIDDKLLYELSIEDKFIGHLLNGNGEIYKLNKIPKEFRHIAIEVAFEPLLYLFDKQCHCNSAFVELPANNINNNDKLSLQFKILCETDNSEFFGAIGTTQKGASFLLQRYEQLPRVTTKKFGQIPLTVRFECGYSLIEFSELSNIELFDIILIDDCLSFEKSHLYINIGSSLTLIGQVKSEKKITILPKTSQHMEKQMEARKESDTVLNDAQICNIPVQLIFQVGKTQLKFGDLMQLQPGYTFELENELNHQVEIKANGKTIGIGELVEIGNRLGVRVVEFDQNHV